MKLNELWLREWVNPSLTSEELAAQLTMAGLEVDARHPVAIDFSGVVVAKVIHTIPHPQADKLALCDVDDGSGPLLRIVCGASNVRPGLMVALARIGAQLGADFKIKTAKLRGELSQGMLCSSTELGLDAQSDGILELPEDAPIGANLREIMLLDDSIFDFDLTPNRADCFSVMGIAREIAALNNQPFALKPPPMLKVTLDDTLSVHVQATDACPKYCGRMIRDINPLATTPLAMKERLRRCGLRSIHPVVDVMNYVMLELGQPMHAFDLKTLEGGIHVRYAHAFETLQLLDEQNITLTSEMLVIADDTKPLALAGIMGGASSAVWDHTKDVYLESAYFNPRTIAGVARQHGLQSDSSLRFERGVDPTLQVQALERATELLVNIVGGQVGPITTTLNLEALPKPITIDFQPSQVQKLTGVSIPEEDMQTTLTALGMRVNHEQCPWHVTVPPHRVDVLMDVCLVEEIIRLHGYDRIVLTPMKATLQPGTINPLEQLRRQMTSFLSHLGFAETITYSFVDPELQQAIYPKATSMRLKNPISPELSVMRVSLWPGLLASAVYNNNRQQTVIKCFEAGVVFDVNGHALQERSCIAGLLTGQHGAFNWSETKRAYDFYDMKGLLESMLSTLSNPTIHFEQAAHPALHPGQTARLMMNTLEIGWMGVLHPRLMDALDLADEIMLFELNLTPLCQETQRHFQPISKYPQIRRDLSLLVDQNIRSNQIEQAVRETVKHNWLKSFDVFDVYKGESIPVDKKSVAVALILQDDHRTLTDVEINTTIDAILKKLERDFGIQCRFESA